MVNLPLTSLSLDYIVLDGQIISPVCTHLVTCNKNISVNKVVTPNDLVKCFQLLHFASLGSVNSTTYLSISFTDEVRSSVSRDLTALSTILEI